MDDAQNSYLHKRLHVFWLEGDAYESTKIFWEILAIRNDKTFQFPSLRSRAYKKMENRGWINVANLDNGSDNLPALAREFLHKLRNHAAEQGVTTEHLPSIQMVLKPNDTDRKAMAQQRIPGCVPYVVLKNNTNPMLTDVNVLSSLEIEWLEARSQWWKRKWVYKPGAEAWESLNQNMDLVKIEPSRPVRWLSLTAIPQLAGRKIDSTCSICLNDICFNGKNMDYVLLSCFHGFHTECIAAWKRHKKDGTTCPICERQLKVFLCELPSKPTENSDSKNIEAA